MTARICFSPKPARAAILATEPPRLRHSTITPSRSNLFRRAARASVGGFDGGVSGAASRQADMRRRSLLVEQT
jgi:hypothetical protein